MKDGRSESADCFCDNEFTAELPLLNDFFTTVRLTTGGICALCGLDVDYTEDVKVCVTEGLLVLKRNGYARAKLSFSFNACKKLRCRLIGLGERTKDVAQAGAEDEISFALLAALVAKNDVEKDGAAVTAISFFA